MRAVHPARKPRWSRAQIAVGDAHERKAGIAVIKDNFDLFLDFLLRDSTQDMTYATAVMVIHVLAALVEQ